MPIEKTKKNPKQRGRKSARQANLDKDAPAFYRLTDMQKKFVLALVENDFDRIAAVEQSGSSAITLSGKTSLAHKWLKINDVNEAVNDEIERRAKELRINKDRVVAEIAKIGFANADDFFEWSGNSVIVKDSSAITRERKAAIRSIKSKRKKRIDKDGNQSVEDELELTLHDKLKALDLLGRHLGIFKDQLTMHANAPMEFTINWENGDEDSDENFGDSEPEV